MWSATVNKINSYVCDNRPSPPQLRKNKSASYLGLSDKTFHWSKRIAGLHVECEGLIGGTVAVWWLLHLPPNATFASGGLVGVRVPGAVLAEGRETAHVGDPRLLVAAVGDVAVVGQKEQAALWRFVLTGAAGDEAPGVVLRGVGQLHVTTESPRRGALIKGHGSPGDTPLLLQLSNFLL